MIKKCSKCGLEKEKSLFCIDNHLKARLKNVCKECYSKKSNDWYKSNKEKHAEIQKRSNIKNLEKRKETEKKYYRSEQGKKTKLNAVFLRKYGITFDKRQQLIEEQGNKCIICDNVFGNSRDIHIDHDHKTSVVRGILCNHCNRGLGCFKDNEYLLQRAIDYLNLFI